MGVAVDAHSLVRGRCGSGASRSGPAAAAVRESGSASVPRPRRLLFLSRVVKQPWRSVCGAFAPWHASGEWLDVAALCFGPAWIKQFAKLRDDLPASTHST